MSKKVLEIVTNQIIEKLEKGVVPWQKPWNSNSPAIGSNKNGVYSAPYRGINAFTTYAAGFDSPNWYTYKQIKKENRRILKGEEKNTVKILKWIWPDESKLEEERKRPYAVYYRVYNEAQLDGYEPPPVKTREFSPIEEAEKMLKNFRDLPNFKSVDQRAYYSRTDDVINMPRKDYFHSDEEYYSTLFHEITHATGHEGRLGRKSLLAINNFGDHSYSKEELVAEMGSAMLCSLAGISQKVVDNQTAYINSWLKQIRKDPKILMEAAAQAQKTIDFLQGQNFEAESL